MKHRFLAIACGSAVLILAACGPAPAASAPPTGTQSTASATPAATLTGDAEGLCVVFSEPLALAALGVPVAAPSSGDVLPRPNGIYCHYKAADDPGSNVEAQLKTMTRDEFEAYAERLTLTEPLAGVGEVAYQLDRSLLGGPGAVVAAWAAGRGVTVTINNDGDAAAMVTAAGAIAAAVLAAP